MTAIRVLIVDDQAAFRRHLRQLLTCAGLLVVGEAGDLLEAKERTRDLQPDLAIVDVNLPGENGIRGTPELIALAPALRVILISAQQDHAGLFQRSALEVGAEDFVSKDDLELEVVRNWASQAPTRTVNPPGAFTEKP